MNVLAFSIKTVPDIDGCRRLFGLHGLSDDDVARAVLHRLRQSSNTEALPQHIQKIVAISSVLRSGNQFKVWSLGDVAATEEDLLKRFNSGIERYRPTLLSWNGRHEDLPVIHYRSLRYAINAEQYWQGEQHHTDLRELLSGPGQNTDIALNEVALLCGFPGQQASPDDQIWTHYLREDMNAVRNGGEIDALNIYLVNLNYLRNRGNLDQANYQQECVRVRDALADSGQAHLQAYEKAWVEL